MAWWTTLLGGIAGGRGFLTRLIESGDNRDRRNLVRHGHDTGGIEGARGIAEAIAEGRRPADERPADEPAAIQAVSERERPKAIESGTGEASKPVSEPT